MVPRTSKEIVQLMLEDDTFRRIIFDISRAPREELEGEKFKFLTAEEEASADPDLAALRRLLDRGQAMRWKEEFMTAGIERLTSGAPPAAAGTNSGS